MKKSSRSTLYLVMVLFAAVAVWFLEQPTEEKRGDILNKPFLPHFDTETVAAIEIEHLLSGVKLKKEEGQWMVANLKTKMNLPSEQSEREGEAPVALPLEGATQAPMIEYKADGNKVSLALDTLSDTELVSLAGNNPEKHGTFEVNAAGMQIRLFDASDKKIEHIYVGKTSAGFLESYIRKEGDNEVYLANRYLRSSFPPTVEDWRNHTIWDTAAANIREIKVDGKWSDKDKELAEKLSKVTASGFADISPKEAGLDKPSITITLTTDAGPLTLKIGKEKEKSKQYYAMKEGDPQIYLVRESVIKALDLK